MKRFACIAAVCLAATLGPGASPAHAQVLPAPSDSKMYVELNFGPTLGHRSDTFVGVEGGYRLTGDLDLIVEAGHMGNVGTTDLDDRATIISNFLGGTASTAFKVNYGAAGVRYNFTVSPMVHPYVLGAVGFAHVKTEVEFTVNGSVIDPASRPDLQLGGDLSGSHNKTMLVFGFGVHMPFKTRFFADLGYRYGEIFAKTENFETDRAIPTQRVVLGVGIRF
jgi:opacity protein-like surface antigen